MKTLMKNNVKILFKNLFLLVVLIGFTAYFGYICATGYAAHVATEDSLLVLTLLLGISVPLFIFFTFFSYEYLVKAEEAHLRETVSSLYGGQKRLYLSKAVILVVLDALYTLAVFAVASVWGLARGVTEGDFYLHVFETVLLNLFLSSLVAVLIALLCAVYLSRIKSYVAMLAAVFLVTPFSDSVLLRLEGITKIKFTHIKTYANILNQDPLWYPDYNYGLALEQFRWSLVAFFIGVLLIAILWKLKNRIDRPIQITAGVLCVVVLLSGVDIINPGSLMRMNQKFDDDYYYFAAEQKEEPADFTISTYDMKIDIDKQLSARVSMDIQGGEGKYRFTLYHGMHISRVTDGQGKSLAFVREGDYLEVTGNNLTGITVEYSGHYPCLYANMQGVWMAANFYYYPVEGYHAPWIVNDSSYSRNFDVPEKTFQVSVSSAVTLYSNLNGTNSSFSGTARGVSLFGGPFLRAYEIGGNTLYKSSIDTLDPAKFEDLQSALDKYNTRVGGNITLESGLKIFISSTPIVNIDRNRLVDLGDHLTINLTYNADDLALNLLLAKIPDDSNKSTLKMDLEFCLMYKDKWIDGMKQKFGLSTKFESSMLQGVRPQDEAMTETRFWMYVKARTMDDSAFFKSIYAYLMDENDRTPELEFIKNLK